MCKLRKPEIVFFSSMDDKFDVPKTFSFCAFRIPPETFQPGIGATMDEILLDLEMAPEMGIFLEPQTTI